MVSKVPVIGSGGSYLAELVQTTFGLLNLLDPFLSLVKASLQRRLEWLKIGIEGNHA